MGMRWTPEAHAVLRKRFRKSTDAELATLLGCSVSAIRNQAFKLGLRRPAGTPSRRGTNKGRSWTRADDSSLRYFHARACTVHELARVLKRSVPAIHSRAKRLGLRDGATT